MTHCRQMYVGDTGIALSFLERKLRSVLKTRCYFGPQLTVQRIGCKQGFLSITERIFFDWIDADGTDRNHHLPASLVLKVPSTLAMRKGVQRGPNDDVARQEQRLEMILKVGHTTEATFYELAMADQQQFGVPIPMCHYAQHFGKYGATGLLLFEDLCEFAAVKPLYEGLSPSALRAIMDEMATLHAYSLTNWSWLSKEKSLKSTFIEVQKAYPDITRQRIYRAIATLQRDFGDRFGVGLLDRLAGVVDDQLSRQTSEHVQAEMNLLPVLTHGDLWTNNILWRKCDDDAFGTTDQIVAVLDWQNAHAGCIGEDFVRLLGSSVDADVRRAHTHELIAYYHRRLTEKLQAKGVASAPFTVDDIRLAYDRLLGQGLLIMLPSLVGYADEDNGLLGDEEFVAERQSLILARCNALIEDLFRVHVNGYHRRPPPPFLHHHHMTCPSLLSSTATTNTLSTSTTMLPLCTATPASSSSSPALHLLAASISSSSSSASTVVDHSPIVLTPTNADLNRQCLLRSQ